MAIEQWWFLSVPQLLWHGASVYNGHIQGPMIFTPNVERGSGAVINCFNDLELSQLGFEHPTFHLRGERSYPLRPRRGSNVQLINT